MYLIPSRQIFETILVEKRALSVND